MGIFEEMGVTVGGMEDELDGNFDGAEEIFCFEVFLSTKQEIEISIQMAELEVEEIPRIGDEYRLLSHTYARLIVEHIGIGTEIFMDSVASLPELDVELTSEERAALKDESKNERGSVLLYTFHVLVMVEAEDEEYEEGRSMGCGFDRSPRAEVMRKVYGDAYAEAEDEYQGKITDAILDHGMLFMKAVEGVEVSE